MQQIVISIIDFLSQHTHDSAPPSVSEEKHESSPSVESPKMAEEEDASLASQDEAAQSVNVQRYLHTDTPVPDEVEKVEEEVKQEEEEEKEEEEVKQEEAESEVTVNEASPKDAHFLLTPAPDALAFTPSSDPTQVTLRVALHA